MEEVNIYETILIFKPDTTPSEGLLTTKEWITKFTEELQKFSKDKKVKVNDVGDKALAYEIKDFSVGHYTTLFWAGLPENLPEIETQLRACDHILKFLTVKHSALEESFEDLEDLPQTEEPIPDKSEQNHPAPDALDVLLGLAEYDGKKEETITKEEEEEMYGYRTGLDVPSIKITGIGTRYGFETEEDYDWADYESDSCSADEFKFEVDLGSGGVLFTPADGIDESEFLENLIEVLQSELERKRKECF